jgi:hypothetical protein
LGYRESDLLAGGIVSNPLAVLNINGFGILFKIVDAAIDLGTSIGRRENRQHYVLSRIAGHRVIISPNERSGLGSGELSCRST